MHHCVRIGDSMNKTGTGKRKAKKCEIINIHGTRMDYTLQQIQHPGCSILYMHPFFPCHEQVLSPSFSFTTCLLRVAVLRAGVTLCNCSPVVFKHNIMQLLLGPLIPGELSVLPESQAFPSIFILILCEPQEEERWAVGWDWETGGTGFYLFSCADPSPPNAPAWYLLKHCPAASTSSTAFVPSKGTCHNLLPLVCMLQRQQFVQPLCLFLALGFFFSL